MMQCATKSTETTESKQRLIISREKKGKNDEIRKRNHDTIIKDGTLLQHMI